MISKHLSARCVQVTVRRRSVNWFHVFIFRNACFLSFIPTHHLFVCNARRATFTFRYRNPVNFFQVASKVRTGVKRDVLVWAGERRTRNPHVSQQAIRLK